MECSEHLISDIMIFPALRLSQADERSQKTWRCQLWIRARQGGVPCVFHTVLGKALSPCRAKTGAYGLSLAHGPKFFLDIPFANDIFYVLHHFGKGVPFVG